MKLLELGMKLETSKVMGTGLLSGVCCTAARWQADLIERRLERRDYYLPEDYLTVEEMMGYINQRM